MKALGPLAVAEQDILAHYVRSNRACSGDYMNASAPRPFSPPGTIFVAQAISTLNVR